MSAMHDCTTPLYVSSLGKLERAPHKQDSANNACGVRAGVGIREQIEEDGKDQMHS